MLTFTASPLSFAAAAAASPRRRMTIPRAAAGAASTTSTTVPLRPLRGEERSEPSPVFHSCAPESTCSTLSLRVRADRWQQRRGARDCVGRSHSLACLFYEPTFAAPSIFLLFQPLRPTASLARPSRRTSPARAFDDGGSAAAVASPSEEEEAAAAPLSPLVVVPPTPPPQSSSNKKKRLGLFVASAALAHPDKAHYGGEDAWFCSPSSSTIGERRGRFFFRERKKGKKL